MHAVVFNERDASFEARVTRELINVLQHLLARIVGGVRLAGKNDLHRTGAVRHEGTQPFDVIENQIGALVGRKPSCKSNRECMRIEQRTRADQLCRIERAFGEGAARFFAHATHECVFETLVGEPERFVVHRQHLLPHAWIIGVSPPGTEMLVEQAHHRAGHPRREVHAVGDVPNGHFFGRTIGPERLAQLLRDDAVTTRDSIHTTRHAN